MPAWPLHFDPLYVIAAFGIIFVIVLLVKIHIELARIRAIFEVLERQDARKGGA